MLFHSTSPAFSGPLCQGRSLASSWCPPRAQIAPFPTLLSHLAHRRHFYSLVLTVNTVVFLDRHFQQSEKVMGDLPYYQIISMPFFLNPLISNTEKAPRMFPINGF